MENYGINLQLAKIRQAELQKEAERRWLSYRKTEEKISSSASRSVSARQSILLETSAILVVLLLIGCGSCAWNIDLVDYTPLPGDDWKVATPAEQGLDPMLLSELYFNAAKLETLYGLLVIKSGYLIAEKYFNEGSIDQLSGRQSTTKSFTSALVGIALDQGYLSSLDQRMMEFFPEFDGQIADARKEQITIRQLLQMRGGYPDEERTPPYFDIMFFSDNWHWVPHLVDFPLVCDPGTGFNYSNLTSHLLGVIVARACETDLMSYAQANLFTPIDAVVADWTTDAEGYNMGHGEIYVTARDMAKFGLLYLNGGEYEGTPVLSADWVEDSLERYSDNIKTGEWLTSRYGSFRDIGYGYQWWSGRVGEHHFDYAAGHGGQYIVLLHELDMVIVTTADPLHDLWDADPWKYEGAINRMVGNFIESLPNE
jgi:CubicO group peptidase (beta-lactamase class C family)